MQITVNDIVTMVEKNITVEQLLQLQGMAGRGGVAVAVNGKIVKRQDWETKILHDLDNVLIINAAYGG